MSRVKAHAFGFKVHNFGFKVHAFGFKVHDFGFKVHGLGFRVDRVVALRVPLASSTSAMPSSNCVRYRVQGSGFRVQGAGSGVQGFRFRV